MPKAMTNASLDKLKKLAETSAAAVPKKDNSGLWVKIASTIVTLLVPFAVIILMQTLGKLETGMATLSEKVQEIDQLDAIRERLIRLEVEGQIISYAQLSATGSQFPVDGKGQYLEMDAVDALEGTIEFDPRRDPTKIKMTKEGTVFLIVAPQVRRIDNYEGSACFTMWITINDQDLANSSIKECFFEGEPWEDTRVSILQAVLSLKAGETVGVKIRSTPETKVGAVAIRPEGVPVVPAAITSLIRLGG
jgi:hypothetical protein